MAYSVTQCDSSVFRVNWITECRDSADVISTEVRLGHEFLSNASPLLLSCLTFVTSFASSSSSSSSLLKKRRRTAGHVCDLKLQLQKNVASHCEPLDRASTSISNNASNVIANENEEDEVIQLDPTAIWAIVNDCKTQYLAYSFSTKMWESSFFQVGVRERHHANECSGEVANNSFKLDIRIWIQYFALPASVSNAGSKVIQSNACVQVGGEREEEEDYEKTSLVHVKSTGEMNAQRHFAELLIKQTNCDVRFEFNKEGTSFGAHSLILAGRSPVLAAILRHQRSSGVGVGVGGTTTSNDKETTTKSGNKKNNPPAVVINIDDVEEPIFKQLLHYIYTGKRSMSLNEDSAKKLVLASDKYHVDDLMDECAGFLKRTVNARNAIELLEWANRHGLAHLKQAALNFIVQHGEDVNQRIHQQHSAFPMARHASTV